MFNYEFMRAEQVASSGQLPNMLEESKRQVPMGVHTYLKVDKATNVTEDPTPHVAAFMLVRQEHWYYFGSTGWMDGDWPWSALYDQLGRCGKPTGLAQGHPAPIVYERAYERCHVLLNCTDTSKDGCRASIDGPMLL